MLLGDPKILGDLQLHFGYKSTDNSLAFTELLNIEIKTILCVCDHVIYIVKRL